LSDYWPIGNYPLYQPKDIAGNQPATAERHQLCSALLHRSEQPLLEFATNPEQI